MPVKLVYFRHDPPNFGDEINRILWPRLLPEGLLDEAEDELFFGAGSILKARPDLPGLKHVAGSGYGGYSAPPDLRAENWNILWLRGPMTAETLGVDRKLAICDAAILLRAIPLPEPAASTGIAFMPHFESATRGDWAPVCAAAGITYLDPRAEVDGLLSAIRGAEVVLTEAMHGAIIADALRTPWVPLLPIHPSHRMKWNDWAASLDLTLTRTALPPSNLREVYVRSTGLDGRGRTSAHLAEAAAARPLNALLRQHAARRLQRLGRDGIRHLSEDARIAEATERSLERLDLFVRPRPGGRRHSA
jgi:succinoglycan biosynthesis protein ExoV